jgi:hypothetical protein
MLLDIDLKSKKRGWKSQDMAFPDALEEYYYALKESLLGLYPPSCFYQEAVPFRGSC